MNYIYGSAVQPTKIIAGAVYIYEGACDEWQTIIDSVENESANPESGVNFELATTANGDWAGRRKNKMMRITTLALQNNDTCRKIHNYFGLLLEEYLKAYSTKFECSYGEHEAYGLLKYEGTTADHYDAHYDGGPATGRWISAILYLNDDYEGGELEFVAFGEKYKPKAGTLVLFPSNYAYTHIAHPVTSGTKYAIVTWITGG